MRGFNKVIIMGNLVADPEIKESSGKPRLSVAVAVNYAHGNGDSKKEGVYYFDVTMFGPLAENVAKYKHKGDPLLVEGILVQQRWETDEGQKKQRVGILAREVQFLNRGSGSRGQGAGEEDAAPPVGDDEIPF